MRHAGCVTSRLRGQHPDLADALEAVSDAEQAALVERIAFHAASVNGLVVPGDAIGELGRWAAELDESGWLQDPSGELVQDPECIRRARAAFAVRDARASRERPAAAADSLYESVIAIGLPEVRRLLA